MSKGIYNSRLICLIGYFFVVVAWIISFVVGTKSIDLGNEVEGYYIFMISCLVLAIIGCVLLSLYSHYQLLRIDGKESALSVFYLFLFSFASIISVIFHFKRIVFFISEMLKKDTDVGVASVLSCSFFLVIASMIGFMFRRKYPNVKIGISWCFFILALCALIKR